MQNIHFQGCPQETLYMLYAPDKNISSLQSVAHKINQYRSIIDVIYQ